MNNPNIVALIALSFNSNTEVNSGIRIFST